MRSHHYHHDCFIIIMTFGDAEDARVVIIIMTVGDAEDAR